MNIFLKRIFSNIPTLETKRLILRGITIKDTADMYEYSQDLAVTKYLLWKEHQSQNETKSHISFLEKKYASGEFYDWGITLKETGKFIGTVGFSDINTDHRRGEIGYVLNPAFWNKGIAAEAAAAVIEFGFFDLDLNRIEARHMDGNNASAAVMKKCGMTYDGTLEKYMFVKNEFKTIHVYSVLKENYKSWR